MKLLILLFSLTLFSQSYDLNNNLIDEYLKYYNLNNEFEIDNFNIRPINSFSHDGSPVKFNKDLVIYESKNKKIRLDFLQPEYKIEYNSRHPLNRNNGTMIPNRGYQHIFSTGFFLMLGPLEVRLKPEHHYSENKEFSGFWDGHYPEIWEKRYRLWNGIDMPERFGEKRHNTLNNGQSKISLNWKNFSIGVSNQNLWWGPSFRNSIMMSNHSKGFKHIFFNNTKPIKTFLGSFDFQLISGKLESSGYNPPNTDYEYNGRKLFVPKITQGGRTDDWRYFQGYILSFSPKLIDGLSLGLIRWSEMYYSLVRGDYVWMVGKPNWFPVFQNLFRKKDKYVDYEDQMNHAAGGFLRWFWEDSKAEIYTEFYYNDSKWNLRDLILDSDHSRGVTIGIGKVFDIKNSNWLFRWEWTQLEQNASRLVRNAGSWYEHWSVFDGHTNNGEVLGAGIGPGSNSHFLSIKRFKDNKAYGFSFEIIDVDNDFYHIAFASARDPRRYWKDLNFHIDYSKIFNKIAINSKFIYSRSLNYQWELDDETQPYFHPGNDTNNFHITLNITYQFN